MNKQDELAGRLVLIHPELEHDPAERQNEIGIIVSSNMPDDDILVGFQDTARALYASDALLVLLPDEQIHQNVADLAYETSFHDLKPLTHIDLILRYGSGDKHFKALDIARRNKNIQPSCLHTLENSLEIIRGRGYE